jgi:large subunit ribosomal protein L39e
MARNIHLARKKRLAKAGNQRSGIPTWVVAKTRGKVRNNPKQRNWRSSKLKV